MLALSYGTSMGRNSRHLEGGGGGSSGNFQPLLPENFTPSRVKIISVGSWVHDWGEPERAPH